MRCVTSFWGLGLTCQKKKKRMFEGTFARCMRASASGVCRRRPRRAESSSRSPCGSHDPFRQRDGSPC
eukprot:1158052-Pyramimonas_sp.AAC.1